MEIRNQSDQIFVEIPLRTIQHPPSNRTAILFLLLLWGQLFYVLAPSWSDGTYYDYGWLVPPIALLFAWRRWQDLDCAPCIPLPQRWPWLLVVAGVLCLVPLRIVEHIDIYWRLPLWAHALLVLAITHLTALLLFGWRASTSLLPATLFTLIAVPLPSMVEGALVQGLTRQVVHLAATALPLAGYPAELTGHALIVRGELLDVAEGCSGIRSFQSSAMAGLCLGELLRLASWKRITLLFLALGLAIACNAARIFLLARIAHDEGKAAMDAAHHGIGIWILVLTYGGISLTAWILSTLGPRKRTRVRSITSAHH